MSHIEPEAREVGVSLRKAACVGMAQDVLYPQFIALFVFVV